MQNEPLKVEIRRKTLTWLQTIEYVFCILIMTSLLTSGDKEVTSWSLQLVTNLYLIHDFTAVKFFVKNSYFHEIRDFCEF